MQAKFSAIILSLLTAIIFLCGASAFGQDIKARMKARLPTIVQLKADGVIGEDNGGFLKFVGDKKAKADVVSAENADRKKVYSAIAKQQGTTAELVGKRRALQIAKKAKPGEWIQNESGNWYRKK